jgi:hypothetical protein
MSTETDIETFEKIEDNSELAYPIKAGDIKKGHIVLIPDHNWIEPELGNQIRKALQEDKNVFITVTKAMNIEGITSMKILE